MIKDITIGQYIPGDSVLHKMDPRTKIILTIIYITTILFISKYLLFFMIALFTLLIIITSAVPVYYTLKGLKPVLFIVLFAAIVNIFFGSAKSTPIFQFGFLKVTWEGLNITAVMTLRITLLMVGASLLTLTTTPILLTDGLEKLLNPMKLIKVPVHEISMMMTIALRFIPTLLEESDKIMIAQASRGADFESGNIIKRARSFVPILVPLFVSAFRRADELATAMESRCYRGSEGRTRMKQLYFTNIDFVAAPVMILFSLGIIYLQIK